MFTIIETGISDLKLIKPTVFRDERGEVIKRFNTSYFKRLGISFRVEEEILSRSKLGAIRGLHFQTRNPQAKIISVIKGKIFDVVIDLRENSESYSCIFCLELSSDDELMLYIPEGFAHGFLTLENDTIVSYPCSNIYDLESEKGIFYKDPDLNIPWPKLDIDYIVSLKDQNLMSLKEYNDSKKHF